AQGCRSDGEGNLGPWHPIDRSVLAQGPRSGARQDRAGVQVAREPSRGGRIWLPARCKTLLGYWNGSRVMSFSRKALVQGVGVNDQWCISASRGRDFDGDVASHLRSHDRGPVAANGGGTSGQGGRGRRRFARLNA